MKNTLCIAALTVATAWSSQAQFLSQDSIPLPSQPAAGSNSGIAAAVQLLESYLGNLKDMSNLLGSIKDQQSADAAAPALRDCLQKIADTGALEAQLNDLSPEMISQLQQYFSTSGDGQQLMQQILAQILTLVLHQCFGSESLQGVLENSLLNGSIQNQGE